MLKALTPRRNFLFALGFIGASLAALAQANPEAAKAFKEANDKMMDAMMMEPSGDADKDFAMMMIPHHQGAIDMAKIELQFGKDPMLRAMAEKIIAAQESEIAELKKWLSEHGM